ncbi:MAG TPA: multidrug efflux SMR transporter [Methyloceanibacter sp.]|jgi:small multidrug resistance pump
MEWVILYVAVLFEVAATTALKASEGFTRLIPSLIVVVGYGVAFYLMTLSLNKIPLAIVYAVWSALGIALISIVGAIRYGESLDAPAVAGLAMIVGGVIVINVFSKSVAH